MIYDPLVPAQARSVRAVAQLITDAERCARILVVDDEFSNLHVLTQILRRAGFVNITGLAEPADVLPAVRELRPDIVLLDLHLPGVDGLLLLADIAVVAGADTFLPVLVLTGDAAPQTRAAALSAGAKDFLTKPYETTEVLLRVRNLIETRLLHVELQSRNAALQQRMQARTEELTAAKLEMLERLARASDFRDEETHQHTVRVGELSAHIGRRLGMAEPEVEQLRVAARLHDIGKIGLSDSILQKPGPLGLREFHEQERHTIIGARILAGSRFPTLQLAEQIALTHHESWDGTGYPHRLCGQEIPLAGRIVAVADVFDALTHARPYKGAWSVAQTLDEIVSQRGSKFDPAVIDAFLDIVDGYVASTHVEFEADLDGAAAVETEAQRARMVRDILSRRVAG